MKHFRSSFLLLMLLFSTLSQASTWNDRLELVTPEDQAKAFLTVRSLIPSMTDGGVRYGFDPIALFQDQLKIEKILSENINFQNLKGTHRDLLQIQIFNKTTETDSAAESTKELLWTNLQLAALAEATTLGLKNSEEVEKEVKKIIEMNLVGKSQGVLIGLSHLLPAEIRKAYFGASIPEKLKTLSEKLPQEIISQGFSAAKFGWSDSEITKADILQRLESILSAEKKITTLLIAHHAMEKVASQKSHSEPWQILSHAQRKSMETWFNFQIAKQIPPVQSKSAPTVMMKIREVPPVIGLFRGFAGNDCSTTCSFPYVNSPNESTFVVYDASDKVKGYIQGTKVLVHEEPYFYLHTIAGPRISTSEALSILSVFSRSAHRMGYKDLALPPLEKIQGLINFIPIREAFLKAITTESMPLSYEDSEIRKSLKTTFRIVKNYDDVEYNSHGFKLNSQIIDSKIQYTLENAPALNHALKGIDKNELILIFIQLGKKMSFNQKMIEALAVKAKLPYDSVAQIIYASNNQDRQSINAYKKTLSTLLKAQGFDLKENYFEKNFSTFAHGFLQSYDLLENTALLLDVIESLIEQREISAVANLVLMNPNLFKNNKVISIFFTEFYRDIHEAEFQDTKILDTALRINLRGFVNNSDLLKVLASSKKATEAVVRALNKNALLYQSIPLDSGESFLKLRQDKIHFRDQLIKSVLATKTEVEFISLFSNITSSISNQDEQKELIKSILAVSIDHFASLNPKMYGNTIFEYIAKLKQDDSTRKMIRKLLPTLIANSQTHMLNKYLRIAHDLKMTSQISKSIDWAVGQGLATHSDLELKNIENLNLFPLFKLTQNNLLRCDHALR